MVQVIDHQPLPAPSVLLPVPLTPLGVTLSLSSAHPTRAKRLTAKMEARIRFFIGVATGEGYCSPVEVVVVVEVFLTVVVVASGAVSGTASVVVVTLCTTTLVAIIWPPSSE
jgi:hypothetical protein